MENFMASSREHHKIITNYPLLRGSFLTAVAISLLRSPTSLLKAAAAASNPGELTFWAKVDRQLIITRLPCLEKIAHCATNNAWPPGLTAKLDTSTVT